MTKKVTSIVSPTFVCNECLDQNCLSKYSVNCFKAQCALCGLLFISISHMETNKKKNNNNKRHSEKLRHFYFCLKPTLSFSESQENTSFLIYGWFHMEKKKSYFVYTTVYLFCDVQPSSSSSSTNTV